MQNTTMEAPRRRPLGVSIIAVLVAIQGIFFLILGILALVAVIAAANSAGTTVNGYPVTGATVSAIAGVLAGIFLVVGLISLLFAWGLWTLKRWAFWATVIIEIISLINSVFGLAQPHANYWSAIVGMIIPIVILVYFLADANVRAAFRT
ncbi:MAG TPA: hypothetical protein VF026_07085 [Ktedonobacteraceae bacterium]